MSAGSTVLLSIHPRHVKKILSGEKLLEFRRVWAKKAVSTVVIYATAPVKRIVAVANVRQVHEGSASRLWLLAKSIGGGLPRRELYAYMKGRKTGFAIELDNVRQCLPAIEPLQVIDNFRPPQSFQYLLPEQRDAILQAVCGGNTGKVIFVAGVHGVGKTSLCRTLASKIGIQHKSAGQIIREVDPTALSGATKAVSDIDHTQELLLEGVDRIRQERNNLLLDGHFALVNGLGRIDAIARDVFEALAINGIILVHDSPRQIYERLSTRDANPLAFDMLEELQAVEVATAESIAKSMAISMVRVQAFDDVGFLKAYDIIEGRVNADEDVKKCLESLVENT